MALVNALALFAVALLTVPALVFCVECAVALLPGGAAAPLAGASAPRPRTVVLVPAHDEQVGIAATIANLRPLLGADDRLISAEVVADNCERISSASTWRAPPAPRGHRAPRPSDEGGASRGFAIAFAMDALEAAPPDVVIIVDADCRVSADGLAILARQVIATNRTAQAEYVLAAPEVATARGTLGRAGRPRAQPRPAAGASGGWGCRSHPHGERHGVPVCGAARRAGTRRRKPGRGHGHGSRALRWPEHARRASSDAPPSSLSSELPESDGAAMGQRRRFGSNGQPRDGCGSTGRGTIAAGIRRANVDLLALGLDLCVPPLALLVMLLGAAALAGLVLAWPLGGSKVPAWVASTALAGVGLSVLGAWFKFGRDRLQAAPLLLLVPLYLLWKLPLYVSLAARGALQDLGSHATPGARAAPPEPPPPEV